MLKLKYQVSFLSNSMLLREMLFVMRTNSSVHPVRVHIHLSCYFLFNCVFSERTHTPSDDDHFHHYYSDVCGPGAVNVSSMTAMSEKSFLNTASSSLQSPVDDDNHFKTKCKMPLTNLDPELLKSWSSHVQSLSLGPPLLHETGPLQNMIPLA